MQHTLQSRYHRRSRTRRGWDHYRHDSSPQTNPHQSGIESSISVRQLIRVLDALAAPDVYCKEEELPRKTRITLAQLRSGECILLNSYEHKIGRAGRLALVPVLQKRRLRWQSTWGPLKIVNIKKINPEQTYIYFLLTSLWSHFGAPKYSQSVRGGEYSCTTEVVMTHNWYFVNTEGSYLAAGYCQGTKILVSCQLI